MLHELNSASDNNIFDTVLDFYGDDFPFKEIPDFFSDLMNFSCESRRNLDMSFLHPLDIETME